MRLLVLFYVGVVVTIVVAMALIVESMSDNDGVIITAWKAATLLMLWGVGSFTVSKAMELDFNRPIRKRRKP